MGGVTSLKKFAMRQREIALARQRWNGYVERLEADQRRPVPAAESRTCGKRTGDGSPCQRKIAPGNQTCGVRHSRRR